MLKHFLCQQSKRTQLQNQIRGDIRSIKEKLDLQHFVFEVIFKNLTDPNDDCYDIWQKIKSSAPYQSQWKTRVPTHWIEIERSLQQLAVEKKPVIKYKDLLKIASSDFPSPKLFVKYMHRSGLLLTLDADNLQTDDDIVIDPQWLIDAFRQVIDFDNCHESPFGHIREIANGKLTMATSRLIWKSSPFQGKGHILLKFMENLGLIAKPIGADFYYIPSLLEPMPGEENLAETMNKWLDRNMKHVSKTLILDYRIDNKQVPFPHFDKVMAEFISLQSTDSIIEFKRNLCIIKQYPGGFMLCYSCSVMKITMFTMDKSAALHDAMYKGEIGYNLLRKIVDISRGISKKFNQQVQDNPIKGLSCNAYPVLGHKNIEYATFDKVQRSPTKTICCKSPYCKMVDEKDLTAWHGKYNLFLKT